MKIDHVQAIQMAYPKIYLACHAAHPRAATNAMRVSARDSLILGHLHPRIAMSPTDLARHLGIRASTLTAAIDRLERLGYVERRRGVKDKRQRQLYLGPEGVRAMQASSVLDTELLTELIARLSIAARRDAVRGIEILAGAARDMMDDRRGVKDANQATKDAPRGAKNDSRGGENGRRSTESARRRTTVAYVGTRESRRTERHES